MLLSLLRRAVALDTDLAEHCRHWAMLGSYRQRHCELRRGADAPVCAVCESKEKVASASGRALGAGICFLGPYSIGTISHFPPRWIPFRGRPLPNQVTLGVRLRIHGRAVLLTATTLDADMQ